MKAALALVAALWLAGCATGQPAPAATLYERLGGRAAITAVVDDAIANVTADPRINARFANAGPGLTKNLVDLVCVRSGGPCRYSGLDMATAHEGMFIRDDEFDALVEDMARSLDKFKVPAREKAEALAILRQMRNAIVGH
ncbi:MAG TPA: group 1 truncated hemoglobin [Burkholderiaceae bacterium]|nr:group 1 truncated hemoglobin [Burkholderiaceae bacterium]